MKKTKKGEEEMQLISDKERLENIKESDIIDAIKGLVGKSETYLSHVDETAIIADVNWLIEQAEKVERYEKALQMIIKDSELSNTTTKKTTYSYPGKVAKKALED